MSMTIPRYKSIAPNVDDIASDILEKARAMVFTTMGHDKYGSNLVYNHMSNEWKLIITKHSGIPAKLTVMNITFRAPDILINNDNYFFSRICADRIIAFLYTQ
jgi:hypothetical protein